MLEANPDPAARQAAFRTMMDEWGSNDPMGTVLFQELWLYGKKRDLDWKPYPLPYLDFGPSNV